MFSHLLQWWYSISSPDEPPPTASFAQRELTRRGRITSLIMLVTVSMVIYAFLFSFSLPLLIITSVVSFLDVIAVLYFNRRGHIIIAGLIITFLTQIGIISATMSDIAARGGIDVITLPFLALGIQAVIVGGSTLPSKSIFVLFAVNIAFFFACIFLFPHTTTLDTYLHNEYNLRNVICIFTTIYIVPTLTTIIWVRSTNQSLRRADRAEDLARLQGAIAQSNQSAVTQKKLLEQGVNELVQCISAIANNPEQELLVDRHKILWQIVVALDTLRKRIAHTRYEAVQLQRTHTAAATLVALLQSGQIHLWKQTGTPIDEIALRLVYYKGASSMSPSPSDDLRSTR